MTIRFIAGFLLVTLCVLQYRLWASTDGMRDLWRLEKAVAAQQEENGRLKERNLTLAAEVRDLKEGRAAIEERARTDLGMVGANETFFQVLPPAPAATAARSPERRTAQASAR